MFRLDEGFEPLGYFEVPQYALPIEIRQWLKSNTNCQLRYLENEIDWQDNGGRARLGTCAIYFDNLEDATIFKLKF